MKINADFSQPVVLATANMPWVSSPMPGVERRMLYREGEEVARATSLVRYAPRSYFSPHRHGGGEEFYVLEGTFSDEHGDYPEGSYLRNPAGSRHKPHSAEGCIILVRLWQMDPDDQEFIRIDTTTANGQPTPAGTVEQLPLYRHRHEYNFMLRWRGPGRIAIDEELLQGYTGRLELYVVHGTVQGPAVTEQTNERVNYPTSTWLRVPVATTLDELASDDGLLLIKVRQAGTEPLCELPAE